MNIHAISKGVVLYFFLLFIFISFFIYSEFSLTEKAFTLTLLAIMFMVGFFTGKSSGQRASLNGFIIGILASGLLIFLISAYTDMQWSLNFFIMIVWITVSTVGAYIGGKFDIVIKSFKAPTPVE